jgi:flavodoxin
LKNILIIHNSKSGNSENLSNKIADGLKDKFNVKVDSIKSINPEDLAKDNPDALIIGGRIIAGNTDRKMSKFVKNLGSYFEGEGQIPKISTFYTHTVKWTDKFSRGMRKAFENSTCIGDVCPEILDIKLEKKKDSIAEGQEAIQNYINMLIDFIGE